VHGAAGAFAEPPGRVLEYFGAPSGDDDAVAGPQELFGGRVADPAGPAADESGSDADGGLPMCSTAGSPVVVGLA
jgi:hypothetical protein